MKLFHFGQYRDFDDLHAAVDIGSDEHCWYAYFGPLAIIIARPKLWWRLGSMETRHHPIHGRRYFKYVKRTHWKEVVFIAWNRDWRKHP